MSLLRCLLATAVIASVACFAVAQPFQGANGASPSGSNAPQQCPPQNQIRLYVLNQVSGALSDTEQFFNRRDVDLQNAFSNSLGVFVNQLNGGSNTYYPGFSGSNSIPALYESNNVQFGAYDRTTGYTTNTFTDTSVQTSVSYGPNTGTPNLQVGLTQLASDIASNLDPNYPQQGQVKIAIIINDGAAWDSPPPQFPTDFSAGFDNSVPPVMLTPGTFRYQTHVQRVDAHYKSIRCSINSLVDSGVHVIHIHSNRSSLIGQAPIPSFASTNAQRGNGAANGNAQNRNAFAPNWNAGDVAPYDFTFNSFDDLMSDAILPQVAALIRKIAAPGPSAAPSCVISGDPHITTFDGLHYDYKGLGDYWLFRSLRTADPFAVQYRAGPCADSSSCVVGVAVSDGQDLIEAVIADRSGNYKNAYLSYNSQRIALASIATGAIAAYGSAQITVNLLGSASYQVKIQYAAGHSVLISRNLLIVTPAPHLYGRSAGMCGNWNGCAADDFLDSCGQVTALNRSLAQVQSAHFGDSWTVAAGESLFSSAPVQGVAGREVVNAPVCSNFNPASWLNTPAYNRFPALPAQMRDYTANGGSPSPVITTFGVADVAQVTSNNPRLIVLGGAASLSAFAVPAQCARLRGALQGDCVADFNAAGQQNAIVDSTMDVLYLACTTYCQTGRMFTNLVAPADCVGAGLCSLGAPTPNLHLDYGSMVGNSTLLPDVSFGNPNTINTFFQPTLGLAGQYLLEVAESDLCGVSRKVEQIDVSCSTPNPVVSLDFPLYTNPTLPTGVVVADSTDPLNQKQVNAIPDPLAGYPIMTIQASVFPASVALGQSWKLVQFPGADGFNNSYTGRTATPSGYAVGMVNGPMLESSGSSRVRFQPQLPGTYVIEYATWTGCTVSRARVTVYAACSLAPPAASIEPLTTYYTNGYNQNNNGIAPGSPINQPQAFGVSNNVAISWAPKIVPVTQKNLPAGATPAGILGDAQNRWMSVTLQSKQTFDVDTPKKMLTYKWSVRADRIIVNNANLDGITLLSSSTTSSPYSIIAQNVVPGTTGSCPATSGTSWDTRPISQINAWSRSAKYATSGSTRTTVQYYGLPVPATPAPVTGGGNYGSPISGNLPTHTQWTQPLQQFSASSEKPSGAVSPFNTLYNAYRQILQTQVTTTAYTELNTTVPLPAYLCKVTLVENFAGDDSTATITIDEVGDVPHPFLPINYCKDAQYTVTLDVNDECQTSSDSIVLQPTCDGYTQAIVECDQFIYWDNTNHNFPAAIIDGMQSYDEMFNSPNIPNYSQINGENPLGVPAGRQIQYQFTADKVTPSAQPLRTAGESLFTYANGFVQAVDTSPVQSITADLPGTYQVGLQVSNRCVVSDKATATVTFSCYGAPDCSTIITPKVETQLPNGPLTAYSINTVINIDWAGIVQGSPYKFQPLTISSATSGHGSASTWFFRHRLKVLVSPPTSAYQTTLSKDFPQLTFWTAAGTSDGPTTAVPQIFIPDVPGTYKVEVQVTDSCGCEIYKTPVDITALCLTTPTDGLVPIKFALANGFNGVYQYNNADEFQASNPYVNTGFIIGTPYGMARTWSLTSPGSSQTYQVTAQNFLFTPTITGVYTVKVDTTDGCRTLTNTTSFNILPVPTGPGLTCQSPTPDASFVVAGATTKSDQSVNFKTWALPKATLVASGAFGGPGPNGAGGSASGPFQTGSGFAYDPSIVEWSIISAPADSIYSASQTGTQQTFTTSSPQFFNSTPSTNKFDPTTNTNVVVTTQRSWSSTTVTTTTYKTIIPLLSQQASLPALATGAVNGVWGATPYASEGFGPLKYGTDSTPSYSLLHSQTCVTIDRPGLYIFQLRYLNLTNPSCVQPPVTLKYTATCNTAPSATVAVTPAAPALDGYKPLRVTVTATGTDPDAGDAAQLSYAWSFVSAPALNSAYDTMVTDRISSQNLTQLANIQLTSPFSTNGQNFPPIFNPHQRSAHFLALQPGNHTLKLVISDGCNVVTQYQYIDVGCTARNNYGTNTAPITGQSGSAQSPLPGGAFTITDATNGQLPVGNGASTTGSDVTRPLATQWRIVGFTPSYNTAQQAGGYGAPAGGTFQAMQQA